MRLRGTTDEGAASIMPERNLAMNCPKCGEAMKPGTLTFRRSFLYLLHFFLSMTGVYREQNGLHHREFTTGALRSAWLCPNCNMLTISLR